MKKLLVLAAVAAMGAEVFGNSNFTLGDTGQFTGGTTVYFDSEAYKDYRHVYAIASSDYATWEAAGAQSATFADYLLPGTQSDGSKVNQLVWDGADIGEGQADAGKWKKTAQGKSFWGNSSSPAVPDFVGKGWTASDFALIITDKASNSGGTGYFLVDPEFVSYAEDGDKAYLNITMTAGDKFTAADMKPFDSIPEPTSGLLLLLGVAGLALRRRRA